MADVPRPTETGYNKTNHRCHDSDTRSFQKKFIENPVYSLTHSRTNNIRQHFVCNLVLDQHRAATRPSAPFKEEIESRPTQDE
jgi:hypothetical protein